MDRAIPPIAASSVIDPSLQVTPSTNDVANVGNTVAAIESALAVSQTVLTPAQMPIVENYLRAQELEVQLGAESATIWRAVREQAPKASALGSEHLLDRAQSDPRG